MKKLILSIIIMALLAITSSCTPYADKFLYDPSQETPELKAKYDKMLEDAEPCKLLGITSMRWLGKSSEYKTADGFTVEDCILTFLTRDSTEFVIQQKMFAGSEFFGPNSILKVVFDEKGRVVRIKRAYGSQ